MTPYKKDSEVVKEFDSSFTYSHPGDSGFNGNDPQEPTYDWKEDPNEVKRFLLQTRHDDLRAIEEWAKNEKMEYEKMRQKEKFEPYRETIGGALSVLSDLLSFIRSRK